MASTSRWQADLCGSLVSQIASHTHSSFGLCELCHKEGERKKRMKRERVPSWAGEKLIYSSLSSVL